VPAEDQDEYAIGSQVLPRGTPVETADGIQVGTVEEAIHHQRENMLDGVVIHTEKGRVFVDAPEVARITNRRVVLTISAAEVAELPPYRSSLGRRFR
jgi:PRC-barrel domain